MLNNIDGTEMLPGAEYIARWYWHNQDVWQDYGSVVHHKYGFPLLLTPDVHFAHPAFCFSSSIAMDLMGPDLSGKTVLDVGCGSGVISIGAAFRNAAKVIATDILPAAVDVARHNVSINGLSEKIDVVQGDLLDGVMTAYPDTKFDLVVANLWFPCLLQGYEESRAASLNAYDRFFSGVRDILNPDGTVYLTSTGGDDNDVAGTLAVMQKHGISPERTVCRVAHFRGAVEREWHLYSFNRSGQAAPPLFIPS